VWVHLTTKHIL